MTDSIRGWSATGRMDVSTEIDDAVERIYQSAFGVGPSLPTLLDTARTELLAAEQRGAAARPAPAPSVDVEALVKSVTSNDHQGFIWTRDVARRIRAFFASPGGKP